MNITGGTKPAEVNRVLRVASAEHSLTSMLRLCANGDTVNFSEKN